MRPLHTSEFFEYMAFTLDGRVHRMFDHLPDASNFAMDYTKLWDHLAVYVFSRNTGQTTVFYNGRYLGYASDLITNLL